ncbi:MAG: tetratricopeptide repeat protein [Robiginitomaculum sp.]|nr:tetratricopeptide repeat protein [Robiginitomaculum sp.]
MQQSSSPYGDYLLARYASSESDVKNAAKYYKLALDKDQENTELRQRVMLSAVMASDIKTAAKLARVILETDKNDRLAVLIAASDEIKTGKYLVAAERLDQVNLGPLNQIAGGLLQSWALYGGGKTDLALAELDKVSKTPLLGDLTWLQRAMILNAAGRFDDADQAFEKAMDSAVMVSRITYVRSLAKIENGKRDVAIELLNDRLRTNGNDIEASFLLERLNAEERIAQRFATPQQGAAEALLGPAQAMAERGVYFLSIIYLEIALYLDPEHDAGQNLLARLYELQNRSEDALLMYAKVNQDQPWYMPTQLDNANTLFRMGRVEEGLSILQQLVAVNPIKKNKRALAVALQSDRQFEAALAIYNELIESEVDADDWQIYFARAISLERTERWKEAVPDFRKSLKINPDQADVLNYLGYTFVDVGENIEEGFELIRKAIELDPEAGYIVDSLGWGYYRLGNYQDAVTHLERAVELEPGEPTINDHLGDAYWQVGRKLEAKFQWQRVLSFEPDEEVDLDKVKDKIENGLRELPQTKLVSDKGVE